MTSNSLTMGRELSEPKASGEMKDGYEGPAKHLTY